MQFLKLIFHFRLKLKLELLKKWTQIKLDNYKNIEIKNFSSSFGNGLAFCALVHRFMPQEIDFYSLKVENKRENLELAFKIAKYYFIEKSSVSLIDMH